MRSTTKRHVLIVAALFVGLNSYALAQQSFYERFREHNAMMAEKQPFWMAPMVQPDSRLGQGLRLGIVNQYSSGMHTVDYGNQHAAAIILNDRIQLSLGPPPYMQNHSAAARDGAGDALEEIKFRVASGNAQHGNYSVVTGLAWIFATGSYQNGAPTGAAMPLLLLGKAFGRFDVQTVLGGVLPTGKIPQQGRVILCGTVGQFHATQHVWLAVENNAYYFKAGPIDGQMQNLVTPAAYYAFRRKEWGSTHPVVTLCSGMQIATSHFHVFNHGLIVETRMSF